MKFSQHSFARGFTMIEVLVVVSIIAILAALAYPMTLRMRAQADSAVCARHLRQIGVAVNAYLGEHGMKFPTMVAAREDKNQDLPAIDTVLLEYVNDETSFKCPSDHEHIFEDTGSSYYWNSLINGQLAGNMDLLGLTEKAIGIPIVSDKENFHKRVGDEVNILYADGHVEMKLQFVVDPN